jgi:hypothetical protein
MMIAILVTLCLTWSVSAHPAAAQATAGGGLPRLKTEGSRLVTDPGGQEVVLRGANIMGSEWDGNMGWERVAFPMLAGAWHGDVVVHGFAADPVNANDPTYLSGSTSTSSWRRPIGSTSCSRSAPTRSTADSHECLAAVPSVRSRSWPVGTAIGRT